MRSNGPEPPFVLLEAYVVVVALFLAISILADSLSTSAKRGAGWWIAAAICLLVRRLFASQRGSD
jgi:hypothetical protein